MTTRSGNRQVAARFSADRWPKVKQPRCSRSTALTRSHSGQATVEIVAMVPLLFALGFVIIAVLASFSAREAAGHAAEAGAIALLQDHDGKAAALKSLSGWPKDKVNVQVKGGRVSVRVSPRLPLRGLSKRLTQTSSTDTQTNGSKL